MDIPLLGWLALAAVAGQILAADPRYAPQRQDQLPPMLEIVWSRGPNLPQGFQDSTAGIVGDTLVTAGGFCAGRKDVPGKVDKYPRGFLNKAWGLRLSTLQAGWFRLPEFPLEGRQGLAGVVVGGKLYAWGGVNYTAPFTYGQGLRLSREGKSWVWERLPDLPTPVAWPGICTLGSKIYTLGGADYDSQRFHTRADRSGARPRLGARFWVIDTAHVELGWKRLPDCPGTPRFTPAMAAAGGKVYLIGGASGDDHPGRTYCTVVDNWIYDPVAGRWDRLRDLPVASGNFPCGEITYQDRYILLVGGYQYSQVENPDGTLRTPYGKPHKHYPNNPYFSDVWVFDTQKGSFGRADPLPLNNNTPITVVHGDRIYLLGGETGGAEIDGERYGHHPDLLLIGHIKPVR